MPKFLFHLSLKKGDEPFVSFLEKLRSVRRGSRISRLFRYVFEHQKINRIIGANIAGFLIVLSAFPSAIEAKNIEADQSRITLNETPLTTNIGVRYPVAEPKINQGYHFFHRAIDLEGVTGDPVTPIMTGVVEKVQYSKYALGNTVYINHGNQTISVYAHLSKIDVEEGQKVDVFTKIGEIGSTGYSTGDHLHLEIHQDGYAINPLSILPAF